MSDDFTTAEFGETPSMRLHRVVVEEQPLPAPMDSPRFQSSSDAVIVPLDAWQRVLNQLGNIHEAGRDLADARERAARAETQLEFLRERLAELRKALEEAKAPPTLPPPAPTQTMDNAPPTSSQIWTAVRTEARRLGNRVVERLSRRDRASGS